MSDLPKPNRMRTRDSNELLMHGGMYDWTKIGLGHVETRKMFAVDEDEDVLPIPPFNALVEPNALPNQINSNISVFPKKISPIRRPLEMDMVEARLARDSCAEDDNRSEVHQGGDQARSCVGEKMLSYLERHRDVKSSANLEALLEIGRQETIARNAEVGAQKHVIAVDPEVVVYSVVSEGCQPCSGSTAHVDHRLWAKEVEDDWHHDICRFGGSIRPAREERVVLRLHRDRSLPGDGEMQRLRA